VIGAAQSRNLGYVIGSGQIKPEAATVQAVLEFPQPITKKDVRSYLGLCGYHRKFMSDFAEVAEPLTALTKKVTPTMALWTPKCQQSFLKLRSLLTSSPLLRAPDYCLPFIVQTDASDIVLGVVL